ncbi:MAG TPA: hypothetical protein VHK90_04410 [Thermoanaerobaculia bacterium]|nr:hypothetical protein [Thermoanaerobaculia bacterium]
MLRQRLPSFSDRLTLRSGLEVSPFCIGLVSDAEVIPAAFDAGINFFFVSADMHWPVYSAARRGLELLLARPGVRDAIVVAAVSYLTQPEFCWDPFVELRGEIRGLDRLDVLVIGGTYASDLLARLDVYRTIVASGRLGARAVAATFHDRVAAAQAVNHDLVELAYARYSPAYPGARGDLFPRLRADRTTPLFNFKSTLGATTMVPWARANLGEEHWYPEVSDFYRFVLSRPELDGVLCSPSTTQQLEELAAALARGPLDEEEETYLLNLCALADGRARLE